MKAWAAYILSKQAKYELSIRPAAAFAMLRRQDCFIQASDYEIRQSIIRHAAKVNLSFVRADRRKHGNGWGYWPPYKAQGEANFYTYDDKFRTFRLLNGLPDREEYFAAVWEDMIEKFRGDGLPTPPYPWAKFRPLLLTQERLGKAASDLPFRCPLCTTKKYGGSSHNLCGAWFVPGDSCYHAIMTCFDCHNILREAKNPDWAIRSRRFHQTGPHAPIASRKVSERAILRAVYELGLIQQGEIA